MRHQHLALLAILNALTAIQNSVVCLTASATSPFLVLDYGDMDDFMKLIQRYQTPSKVPFPYKENEQDRKDEVFYSMALEVRLAVIYVNEGGKW